MGTEREIEVPAHQPTVLVSEFGQWLRRFLLVLLVVTIGLILVMLAKLGTLESLIVSNSHNRNAQNCAILHVVPQTAEVVAAAKETC